MIRFAIVLILFSTLGYTQDSSIESVAIEYRQISTELNLDGVVEAVNSATVSAQTSGKITEINFDVNDYVSEDSVIIRIREVQQSTQLAQAEANESAASAKLLQAQTRFKRAQKLQASNNISKADFDSTVATLKASKADRDAATAAVERARDLLGYTVVKAPFSGIVTARHAEEGEFVSPGQPLMSGFSLDQLRVKVSVPQRLIQAIRKHKAALVTPFGLDEIQVQASDITIYPYANQQSNTVDARIKLPTGVDNLFPGMLTKVAFTTSQRSGLVIPESAVVHRSEVTGAYTIDTNGRITLRQIRIGKKTADGMIEVLAGLRAGDRVAVDPIVAGISQNRARLVQ